MAFKNCGKARERWTAISIMKIHTYSRRNWISSTLVACSAFTGAGLASGKLSDRQIPGDYTRSGPVNERGKAPGLKARLISEQANGQKTYAIIFATNDEVLSGLTEFAKREKLTAAHFSAVGVLKSVRFEWFDHKRKCPNIPVDQQVEIIALIGDVGLINGQHQVHAHSVVGLPDGEVRSGHLLQAIAGPTLEIFLTTSRSTLINQYDEETDLSLFSL